MLSANRQTLRSGRPLISRSMSKITSMRLTASRAKGAIAVCLPSALLRALAAMSASTKNLRLPWLQHAASMIRPGDLSGA